jgi:hypothetical protein
MLSWAATGLSFQAELALPQGQFGLEGLAFPKQLGILAIGREGQGDVEHLLDWVRLPLRLIRQD